MTYPFVSANYQPIVPGSIVTYKSRRYGEVFAEVDRCVLKRHCKWGKDENGRHRKIEQPVKASLAVHVTRSSKDFDKRIYYATAVSPGRVTLIG